MTEERSDWVYIAIVCLLGLAIRLDFLFTTNFIIDSDEAIVGLMAKHFLDGKGMPFFYYGQHYMGSLEPLCVAGAFSLFGISNIVLKAVPLVFSILLIPLIYCLGTSVGTRLSARVAALLCAVPPVALVEWSSKARGGFIELLVIGSLALLFTLRWFRGPSVIRTAIVGILLGLGWWVNNQIIFFMLPIGLFMFFGLLRPGATGIIKHGIVGIAAWFLGSLPFWLDNYRTNFASFRIFHHASKGDLLDHFTGLFTQGIPAVLGAMRFWHSEDVFHGSTVVAYVLYGMLFLVIIEICRSEQPLGEMPKILGVELLLGCVVTTLLVFSLSSYGFLVQAPRYLLPLYVPLFVLSGYGIDYLARFSHAMGGSFLSIILVFNMTSTYLGGRAIPGQPHVFNGERVSSDHTELISWLRENDVHWVRTNYWIGYRLAFETKEDVRFLVFQEPFEARIQDYVETGAHLHPEYMPLILVPAQAKLVEEALKLSGDEYERIEKSGYVLLYGFKLRNDGLKKIPTDQLRVESNSHPEVANLAIDGDEGTRWGSAAPQSPEMTFMTHFASPQPVTCMRYDLAQWSHDAPRQLTVEAETASGERVTLLSPEQYQALRYYGRGGGPLEFCGERRELNSVIMRQQGSDPVFDWSIAELSFFK